MRIGICTSPENAEAALAAGFDYVELAAAPLAQGADYSGLGCEACNVFFPWTMKLWEDFSGAMRHARAVVDGAAKCGISVLAVGSGGPRTAPPEWPAGRGDELFSNLVAEIAEIARPRGIEVGPESLRREESNVAVDYARMDALLAERGTGIVCDAYHVMCEADPLDWSAQIRRAPIHVHLASAPNRDVPEAGDARLLGFMKRLAEVGYEGRISFEGALNTSLEEAARRLKALAGAQ